MITQALTTKQNNTRSSRNRASNSGSVNAADQTERRQQHDERRRKDNIKLKQLSLATYNVRTLQQTGKFDQLTRQAVTLPTDIIAVQEHRMITSLDIDTIKSDDGEFTFIFATATKQKVGGVGILIRKRHSSSYLTSEKVSDRIIKAYFAGNPMVTIIAAYAPTETATVDDKEDFYSDLLKAIESEPPHNVIIVLGDFNARIGDDSHKINPQIIGRNNYHDKTNDNGKRLVSICQQTNLRQVQSRFPQPSRKQWTWKHPRGSKAQLDHILVNAKWVRSITNCRVYNSIELDSDHRIVSANFKIRFRKFKQTPSDRKKYNWNKVIENLEICQQYQLELKNRFDALPEVEDSETMHNDIVEIIGECAQNVIGNPPKRRPKQWVSDASLTLVANRDNAKKRYHQKKTAATKERWRNLAKQVQESYLEDERRYMERQIAELEQANRQGASRRTWKIMNDISGKSTPCPAGKVKKLNGDIVKSPQELLDEWRKYFSNLLNAPPVTSTREIPPAEVDLEIKTGDFDRVEIDKAIKSLNNYKAPGFDYNITAEAIKYGGDELAERLLKLVNLTKNQQKPPSDWIKNLIVPLPKKGDLTKITNYRGITLMSIAAKLYNKLLLNRMRDKLDAKLRMNQAGYRPGRGCTEHVHVLRRILEGCDLKNLPLVAVFVDFKKAFDSIDRNVMFKILRHYGVPEPITNAIRLLYEGTRSAVIINGTITDEFEVNTGVLQGDVLAPYLFIVVIDWVMRNADIHDLGFTTHKRQSSRIPEKKVGDLEYADDIGLLENDTENAQKQLDAISEVAKETGLLINVDKTKVLSKNINPAPKIMLDGTALVVVNDFQYLGAWVNDTLKDFKHRRAKAWTAFWKLKKIWDSNADIKLKITFFNASVLFVLLYATESYVIDTALQNKINAFQTQCLRIILKISKEDHVTNEHVHKLTNTHPLMKRVTKSQLSFLGHSIRRSKDDLIQQYCLYVPAHGQRSRGRPKTTYKQHIAKSIYGDAMIEEKVLRDAASDRVAWRNVVKAASRFFDTG